MTFQDLPAHWREHLITADNALDAIDLYVSVNDRSAGCLLLVLCDPEGRSRQPVIIDDPPPLPGDYAQAPGMVGLAQMLAEFDGTVLFARGRPGRPEVGRADLEWARTMSQVFGHRLRGSYLATPRRVSVIPNEPESRAS